MNPKRLPVPEHTRLRDLELVALVDDWVQEESEPTFGVSASRAYPAQGSAEGAMAEFAVTGGGHCDEANGMYDLMHRATVFVASDGARLRHAAITTEEEDCRGPVRVVMQVRGSDVVVRRVRNASIEVGTHSIASLLR